jgi:hypothetical protein
MCEKDKGKAKWEGRSKRAVYLSDASAVGTAAKQNRQWSTQSMPSLGRMRNREARKIRAYVTPAIWWNRLILLCKLMQNRPELEKSSRNALNATGPSLKGA